MNERRRTLLFSSSNIPTENGVYIESVDHEFYLTNDWDSKNKANSIAVVADECKFRMSTAYTASSMHSNATDTWSDILTPIANEEDAITDYDGIGNTNKILSLQQSANYYAAGWCNKYTFPDGITHGYLPALGELCVVGDYRLEIYYALSACGSTVPINEFYWSSTYYKDCTFWYYNLRNLRTGILVANGGNKVLAFAPLK